MTLPTHLVRALIALAFIASPCLAATDTFEHKLDNGLRVIVKPDRRSPVVVSMLWYHVGSSDESTGVTGVAHVLEHLMFKGTPTVPNGEYARVVSAAGGRLNAFTSKDYTSYFIMLSKSRLELSLSLEADRMVNLILSGEEFGREIKVVMEERRWRYEDQPQALTYEQLMAAALKSSPHRNPIIGWMNDLQNMRVEDAREFYQRWYSPNNALLVVVGDVSPDEVFAMTERHFGRLAPRTLPVRRPQDEPPQLGIKRLTVKAPAELPYVFMAYRVPKLRDPEKEWEPFALEVLENVLSGDAGRLTQAVVRGQRIATNAHASYGGLGRGPGMFYLFGSPIRGVTAAALEEALRSELKKIVEHGVSEEELTRVKAQAVAANVFERDSMYFQARMIGQLELSGISHKTLDLQLRKLQEITAAQVQEVARKYLVDDGLTVAYLEPQPVEGRKPSAPPAGLLHAQ